MDIIMLKNCDNQLNLISFEIKCTDTKKHKILTRNTKQHTVDQIKNKPQDIWINTSNGNRVLCIAGYRTTQEFDSQEHATNQSHD